MGPESALAQLQAYAGYALVLGMCSATRWSPELTGSGDVGRGVGGGTLRWERGRGGNVAGEGDKSLNLSKRWQLLPRVPEC